MHLAVLIVTGLLSLGDVADAARILGVFQMPAVSHHQVFQPVWRELSLRGHQVTVVTPFPLRDEALTNLTEIDVSQGIFSLIDKHGFQFYMNKQYGVQEKIPKIFAMNNDFAEVILSNPEFVKIYNGSFEKFDLIIAQTYVIPTLYSLSAKLGAPFVGISSMDGWIGSHLALGDPHPPSMHSEMFLPYHGTLTFYERFRSTLYNLWVRYYLNFVAWPECDRIARRYLGNDLPYISEIERNMSMLFLTTNRILHVPRPTVPSIVSLEHVHVKPPKMLPKDLKDLLDSAKKGAVYFSLGSNVKSVNTSQNFKERLLEAFAELPYKVLWKFEGDSLPKKPDNVITRKWLPQQDILAHPNVKVFFTQCGLQSTEESVDRVVPIVAMPFIADQEMNTKRLVAEGAAVGLDYLTATKEDIKKAVIEVAENPKYKENMKRLKDLWLDHPMKSIDRAVWWIEYVIRHKGARHLRSPTADISWMQFLLVDVALAMLAIVIVAGLVLVKSMRLLMSVLVGKRKVKKA